MGRQFAVDDIRTLILIYTYIHHTHTNLLASNLTNSVLDIFEPEV